MTTEVCELIKLLSVKIKRLSQSLLLKQQEVGLVGRDTRLVRKTLLLGLEGVLSELLIMSSGAVGLSSGRGRSG